MSNHMIVILTSEKALKDCPEELPIFLPIYTTHLYVFNLPVLKLLYFFLFMQTFSNS